MFYLRALYVLLHNSACVVSAYRCESQLDLGCGKIHISGYSHKRGTVFDESGAGPVDKSARKNLQLGEMVVVDYSWPLFFVHQLAQNGYSLELLKDFVETYLVTYLISAAVLIY